MLTDYIVSQMIVNGGAVEASQACVTNHAGFVLGYYFDDLITGEVTQDMVDVKFEEYLCDIKVTDQEGTVHVLNLYKLSEKVEPDNCSVRVRPNRITITLKKWLETSWKDLTRAATTSKKK